VILRQGEARLDGLQLAFDIPLVRGVSAEITLTPAPGESLALPQDLLAVIGWDWELPRFEIPPLPRRCAPSRWWHRRAAPAPRSRMLGNPMNIPPVSIAAAKAALIEQYADPVLRRRATMLWGRAAWASRRRARRWRRTSACRWSTCG
jgi:hypothetical protein